MEARAWLRADRAHERVDGRSRVGATGDPPGRRKIADPQEMKALGFCVTIEHARFMAERFTAAGMASVAVWGDSPTDERRAALRDLDAGRVNVVFTVDLFNEGVDVPNVDTLLLLRPTESPTLFLQQLGRGLRRARRKAVCTVLDFVGNHRREFRFDRRFRALLGGTRRDVTARSRRDSRSCRRVPHGTRSRGERDRAPQHPQAIPSEWRAKRGAALARRRVTA